MPIRVAIVTESFAPDVNGVANSVLRIAEHLVARGHQPLVVAPQPSTGTPSVAGAFRYPVVRIASLPMPGYRQVRVALPSRSLAAALREHGTELVHLASPFVLGARASAIARRADLPVIAVYQTDLGGYASAYRMGAAEAYVWRRLRAIHNSAGRTLAPSTASATALQDHGIQRVWLWRRGVDTVGFDPAHRSTALRRVMPGAIFLGVRRGGQLSRLYASFDLFVHTGPFETFGQTVQEAQASGLPVVAPAAGGPLDLIDHGRTGYLVPPNDPDAITAAVADLAAEPLRRAEFGRLARAAVASRTWQAVCDELIGHYVAVHSGELRAAPERVTV